MAELLSVLKTLTVADLQSELKSRGLKKSGNKAALVKRLEDYIRSAEREETDQVTQDDTSQNEVIDDTPGVTSDIDVSMNDCDDGARKLTEELTEPIHTDEHLQEGNRVVHVEPFGEQLSPSPELLPAGQQFTEPSQIQQMLEQPSSTDEPSSAEPCTAQHSIERLSDSPIDSESNSVRVSEEVSIDQEQCIGDVVPIASLPPVGSGDEDSKMEDSEVPITNILHQQFEESVTSPNLQGSEDGVVEQIQQNEFQHEEQEEALDYEEMDESVTETNETQNDRGEKEDDGEVSDNQANEIVHKEVVTEVAVEKPKVVKPVHLKKTVSLKGNTNETAQDRAERRKRRWGSTTSKEASVAISSDSIKKLIPDVKIDPADVEHDENDAVDVVEILKDDEKLDSASPRKKGRQVKLDSAKTVVLGQRSVDNTEAVVIHSDTENMEKKPEKKQSGLFHSLDSTLEDDLEVQPGNQEPPSPSKNTPSAYIHVENLVRPFTINQLKRLISKSATISEFWINNIKSHCYVQVSSKDEAQATRDALHGLKWPSGSPKVLKVDFAVEENMYKETDGTLGKQPKIVVEINDDEDVERRKDEKKQVKRKEEKGEKKETTRKDQKEESPAKLLDDLFRKTKTTPCIYWLPLTEAEVLKRKKESQQSNRQTQPDRRNNSPDRRQLTNNDRRRTDRSWR